MCHKRHDITWGTAALACAMCKATCWLKVDNALHGSVLDVGTGRAHGHGSNKDSPARHEEWEVPAAQQGDTASGVLRASWHCRQVFNFISCIVLGNSFKQVSSQASAHKPMSKPLPQTDSLQPAHSL